MDQSNDNETGGKILAADLARILDDAAIFALRDSKMPTINAVRLESSAKNIVAIGTDRFVMGASAVEYPDGDGPEFAASLRLTQAQMVARIAKSCKAAFASVSIEVSDAGFVFTFTTGETYSAPKVVAASESAEFPDWRKLIDRHIGLEVTGGTIGMNPQYLAKFGRVHDAHRMVLQMVNPMKPVIVRVSTHFIGLIMPIRLGSEAPALESPEWLTQPKPKADSTSRRKPAAKRAGKKAGAAA